MNKINSIKKNIFSNRGAHNQFSLKAERQKTPFRTDSQVVSLQGARGLKALSFAGIKVSEKPFAKVRADENNPKWENIISRRSELYQSKCDLRSEFKRDFDRILHSEGFSRSKRKAQVFLSPKNDHNCTRIEHVLHVASVSEDIANNLGLNAELARAIALGHDIGHSPFGHEGEKAINLQLEKPEVELTDKLWHEKNGLKFVDKIETLPDPDGFEKNLNLTYAVRDGIICHCGEVNQNYLRPRDEAVDLDVITKPNQYAPYTWEGCVVKVADKIAYLGRDLKDAADNKILTPGQKKELNGLVKKCTGTELKNINNGNLIKGFIKDITEHSTPDKGIALSKDYADLMNTIKKFNYEKIYRGPHRHASDNYVNLVIGTVFDTLNGMYDEKGGKKAILRNVRKAKKHHPNLCSTFEKWLVKYSDAAPAVREKNNYANEIVYSLDNKKDYQQCIVDYISGMTDDFAMKSCQEIVHI